MKVVWEEWEARAKACGPQDYGKMLELTKLIQDDQFAPPVVRKTASEASNALKRVAGNDFNNPADLHMAMTRFASFKIELGNAILSN